MTPHRTALSTAIFAVFLGSSPVSAETAPARPTDAIYSCASKTVDAERLACFDKAVADLRGAETTGKVRTVDLAAVEKIERESFGFSLPSLTEVFRRSSGEGDAKDAPVENISSGIKSLIVNKITRKATIRLENGQTWEQIDSEELSRSKVRKAKQAEIRRAALGSFLMNIDGGTAIRVRRVS
jgi:hypothetical protein